MSARVIEKGEGVRGCVEKCQTRGDQGAERNCDFGSKEEKWEDLRDFFTKSERLRYLLYSMLWDSQRKH